MAAAVTKRTITITIRTITIIRTVTIKKNNNHKNRNLDPLRIIRKGSLYDYKPVFTHPKRPPNEGYLQGWIIIKGGPTDDYPIIKNTKIMHQS